MLVLNALDDPEWDGRWRLSDDEVMRLLRQIEADDSKFLFDDGKLHCDEITGFSSKEKNRDMVLALPNSIHGILNEPLVRDAFRTFDMDGSGSLDSSEWVKFVRVLEGLHTQFLLRRAFSQFRAFFGRGQSWQTRSLGRPAGLGRGSPARSLWGSLQDEVFGLASGTAARRETRMLQLGCDRDCEGACNPIPPGWWADLHYYSANNHPVHGILACDPNHSLSRLERVGMELSTFGFSFFVVGLQATWVEQGKAPVQFLTQPLAFSILIVTIPGIVIWQLLFFLFTCPKCGLVDLAQAGTKELSRARLWSGIGAATGWSLLVLGLLYLGLVAVKEYQLGDQHQLHSSTVLLGRLRGYIVSWVLMLLLSFNPFIAWGQPDPAGKCSLGDIVGLGQWRIEKQRFQNFCLDHLDKVEQQLIERRACMQPRCTMCNIIF